LTSCAASSAATEASSSILEFLPGDISIAIGVNIVEPLLHASRDLVLAEIAIVVLVALKQSIDEGLAATTRSTAAPAAQSAAQSATESSLSRRREFFSSQLPIVVLVKFLQGRHGIGHFLSGYLAIFIGV
jgi:hypothetical protein